MAETMRLDRFLWWARLAKTRGAAQAIVADGHVRVDGRPIGRNAATIRVRNVMVWIDHGQVRVIRVDALPTRRGPAPEARACYTELAENVSQQPPAD